MVVVSALVVVDALSKEKEKTESDLKVRRINHGLHTLGGCVAMFNFLSLAMIACLC